MNANIKLQEAQITIRRLTKERDEARKEVVEIAMRLRKLQQAAREFYQAVPLDVLRMKAGNGFLDMERVDEAAAKLAELLK